MDIVLKHIKIKDIVNGFRDDKEDGIVGYGGKLDIRPPYQREFIYNEKKQKLVIDSVLKGFPLNAMYWVVRDDGRYEVLDGQQRTLSICKYANGEFSYGTYGTFTGLPNDKKDAFYNYDLLVYFCEGKDSEKIDWFERINVAGIELNAQEIRNAVYAGPFTNAAKKYFSKQGSRVFKIGEKYLNGSIIRQDYLETVLKWISNKEHITIETYMSNHKVDEQEADKLKAYFESVISWIKTIFSDYKREMKGLNWGEWYNDIKIRNKFTKDDEFNIEERVQELMEDPDVTNNKGIYEYILTGEEKHLNIRTFDFKQKRIKYEEQDGKCAECGKEYDIKDMDADHITPWIEGGKTEPNNLQILCKKCNRRKGKK